MLKRCCHLLVAAGVAALVVAPTALASHAMKYPPSCISAVCVYTEPNAPGVGGPSYGGPTSAAQTPLQLSPAVASGLAHGGGKDTSVLKAIATNPSLGTGRLSEGGLGPVAAPNALGAALDIGSGPAVLFAALLGAAVLVAVWYVRSWRRGHP